MRNHHLTVDHDAAPIEFPPTWHEFETARRRFFARLSAAAAPARDTAPAKAEPPKEGAGS